MLFVLRFRSLYIFLRTCWILLPAGPAVAPANARNQKLYCWGRCRGPVLGSLSTENRGHWQIPRKGATNAISPYQLFAEYGHPSSSGCASGTRLRTLLMSNFQGFRKLFKESVGGRT